MTSGEIDVGACEINDSMSEAGSLSFRWVFVSSMLLALCAAPASAQTGAGESLNAELDSVRHWYDTIAVTRPRFARATLGERLALAAFTSLALPVGIAVGGLTLVPPTLTILQEHDGAHAGIALGTGWGIGGDTTQMIYYPDVRVQFDVGYYIERERNFVVHAALLTDLRVASLNSQDFLWFAIAGGAGVATDLHNYEPYAEGWVGVMNPMGIRYVPLFPMHHVGLRVRVGRDVVERATWYEVSVGVTSTFGF